MFREDFEEYDRKKCKLKKDILAKTQVHLRTQRGTFLVSDFCHLFVCIQKQDDLPITDASNYLHQVECSGE